MKHTIEELYQWQALPLSVKLRMTQERIRSWVNEYGEDGVYVSFSGGKDSTVLLDIVRKMYPGVVAMFSDTGLEYPEIREFVKTFDNVDWVKPKMTFKEVIEKYGYPFISKEVSLTIYELQKSKNDGKDYTKLAQYKRLTGTYTVNGKKAFSREKYKFLLDDDAPKIGSRCCNVMKKNPSKDYEKQTGRKAILGTMASESKLRTLKWLETGCNGFELTRPTSKPMSFWTDQDVLLYIKQNNLPICSIYGDIVEDLGEDDVAGQMTISDLDGWQDVGIFDAERKRLKTTGCERTGCMFCGYGCHLNNDQRFVNMKTSHPNTYEYIMKSWDDGGLDYKNVIDWLNQHGNLKIKY